MFEWIAIRNVFYKSFQYKMSISQLNLTSHSLYWQPLLLQCTVNSEMSALTCGCVIIAQCRFSFRINKTNET